MEKLIKAVGELRSALLNAGIDPIDLDQVRISLPYKDFERIKHEICRHFTTVEATTEIKTDDRFMLHGIEVRRKPIGAVGDDSIPMSVMSPKIPPKGYRYELDGSLAPVIRTPPSAKRADVDD